MPFLPLISTCVIKSIKCKHSSTLFICYQTQYFYTRTLKVGGLLFELKFAISTCISIINFVNLSKRNTYTRRIETGV